MIETKPFSLAEAALGLRPAIPWSDWAKSIAAVVAIYAVFMLVSFGLGFVLREIGAPDFVATWLPFLLLVPLLLFLWGPLRRWSQKRTMSRSPTLNSPASFTFDENGIRVRSDLINSFISWKALFLLRENAKTIMFYLGPCGAYAVPKAELGADDSARAAALAQIRAWIKNSGVQIAGVS